MVRLVSILSCLYLLCGCSYDVEKDILFCRDNARMESGGLYIENWNVVGPFTLQREALLPNYFLSDPMRTQTLENPDTLLGMWYNGVYHPKYGQLDLREVFGISLTDTTRILDSTATYLYCPIQVERSRNMFLYVNTEMECLEYINGAAMNNLGLKDLVKDCKKYGIQCKMTMRRNSGQGYHGYHRIIVGREACDFFKGKVVEYGM